MSEEKIIEVACGVLIREDGAVLIGSRPEGKPYAGYWEFPGGKLEDGETVGDALKREFREELDMTVNSSFPWFVTEHRYEHGHVPFLKNFYFFISTVKQDPTYDCIYLQKYLV